MKTVDFSLTKAGDSIWIPKWADAVRVDVVRKDEQLKAHIYKDNRDYDAYVPHCYSFASERDCLEWVEDRAYNELKLVRQRLETLEDESN